MSTGWLVQATSSGTVVRLSSPDVPIYAQGSGILISGVRFLRHFCAQDVAGEELAALTSLGALLI